MCDMFVLSYYLGSKIRYSYLYRSFITDAIKDWDCLKCISHCNKQKILYVEHLKTVLIQFVLKQQDTLRS